MTTTALPKMPTVFRFPRWYRAAHPELPTDVELKEIPDGCIRAAVARSSRSATTTAIVEMAMRLKVEEPTADADTVLIETFSHRGSREFNLQELDIDWLRHYLAGYNPEATKTMMILQCSALGTRRNSERLKQGAATFSEAVQGA